MKLLKLLIIPFLMVFCTMFSGVAQNISINIIAANAGQINVGEIRTLTLEVRNNASAGGLTVAANRLRPQISFPTNVQVLPTGNANHVLPGTWAFTQNDGQNIRLCQGTGTLPANTTAFIQVAIIGVSIGGPATIQANLGFSTGTNCTGFGSSTPGDLGGDNSGQASIQTNPAPACNLTAIASAGTIACAGQTTTLTVTPSGANGNVEYSLNGGSYQDANTFSVPAGDYVVTVREKANPSCSTSTASVNVPDGPTTTWYKDLDNDLYSDGITLIQCDQPAGYKLAANLTALSGDCDDNTFAINPGATEICNGLDDNCNGTIDEGVKPTWYKDIDNDGYSDGTSQEVCERPTGYKLAIELTATSGDCNDDNTAVNPGATEICNGIDDNCNGTTDEGFTDTDNDGMADCVDTDDDNDGTLDVDDCAPLDATKYQTGLFFVDADGDTYGTGTSESICYGATTPAGYSTVGGDCNDANAAINPGATEVCDGVDNNCNGTTDEGFTDTDNDGMADCVDTDDDNDGTLDVNDCAPLDATKYQTGMFFVDADGDNYGTGTAESICYGATTPSGYSMVGGDCNDANAAINPGATEICDGIDNNCNDVVDENCSVFTWFLDADGDTYGNPSISTTTTVNEAPAGYVANNTDCNDANAAINPGATEICDGIDNNCNGTTDEGFTDTDNDGMADCVDTDDDNDGTLDVNDCAPLDATKYRTGMFFVDADGDTYGTGNAVSVCYGATTPSGYSTVGGDCNDANAAINPGATEICDGIDNNCNGSTDEGFTDTDNDGTADCVDTDDDNDGTLDVNDCAPLDATKWRTGMFFVDADGDLYGTGSSMSICYGATTPAGYSTIGGDCNDANAAINPGAAEICDNGIDDNCNGATDEGCGAITTWYYDADEDGYGIYNKTLVSPTKPNGKWVLIAGDCKPTDPTVFPGAPEMADGKDNDCNGQIDEGTGCTPITWYYDADGDGFGISNKTRVLCVKPNGKWVNQGGDCDPNNPNVYPGAGCGGSSPAILSAKSIESVEGKVEISLAPNPAVSMVTVKLNGFEPNKQVSLVLMSIDGRQVTSRNEMTDGRGQQQVRFNVGNTPNGVYLIQAKQGMISETVRLMVAH